MRTTTGERNDIKTVRKLLIIAGEASGDLHGANLVQELRQRDPSVAVFGVGSRKMR